MIQDVLLTLKGVQRYQDQEPDTIELVTEGTLERTEEGWNLSYEESELTGLAGVRTTFLVRPGCITLSRTGNLTSTMVFEEGVPHESLYRMSFGALLLRVCATKLRYDLSKTGGTIDLNYSIEIEQTGTGYIDYHLDIQTK